jgi:hypothetical protein
MYWAEVYGAREYADSDKELAFLEAKRYSAGECRGTEVHLMHDGKLARIYYDGHLTENFEEE